MINAFITYIEAEKRYSALTVRNYRHDLEIFAEWWCRKHDAEPSGFDVTQLREEDIRQWIMHRTSRKGGDDKGISTQSMNRELSTLRSFLRFLRKRGVIEQDLFKRISALKTARRLPTFVPETRMECVLDSLREESEATSLLEQRNALIVALFYGSGIRLAELHGAKLCDLSEGYATLRVRGKGDKERIIPITRRLREEIRRFTDKFLSENICKSQEKALFLSKQGERISRSDVQRSVARLLRECGVEGKCSPHVLRHTFATHLLNDGADLREIQELMGHSSLRATQVYTHSNIAQLRNIYDVAHPRSGGAASAERMRELSDH
jgi:integrase/recombinase XerC